MNPHAIPYVNEIDGQCQFFAVGQNHRCGLRRQPQQLPHRFAGSVPRSQFHQLPEQHQQHNGDGAFPVRFDATIVHPESIGEDRHD